MTVARQRLKITGMSQRQRLNSDGNAVELCSIFDRHQFLPRDALYPRRSTSHGPVFVCLSQVGVLSKRMDESSWFLACELPSTRPTLC